MCSQSKLARAFIRAIPGVEDYSLLGKICYHALETEHGAPKYDLVILDGPATGHLTTLLGIPQVIIDTVPAAPLIPSAAAARDLLIDGRRCQAIIVTLAEEMPTTETIELAAQLQRSVGMHVHSLVVNQLFPPRFLAGPSLQVLDILGRHSEASAITPLLAAAQLSRRRRELNDRYLERLRTALDLPQAHLPFLFTPDFGPSAVEDLSYRLEGQLLAIGSIFLRRRY